MAYVIIQGRGLSGALHGEGMQRGMRDGMGPTFPLTQDGMFREPAQYTQTNKGPVDGIGGCPPGFIDDNGRCAPVTRVLSNGNTSLSGPLKLTIEHLGGGKTLRPGQEHVRNGLRGLGDAGVISDGEARQRLDNLFATTCQAWIQTLNAAIDDAPITLRQTIANLKGRRDQITNQVLPDGISVIEDTTLSLDEVTRRVTEFLSGFLDVIKLDISNAQQAEKHTGMVAQLQTLATAMQTVLIAAAKAAGKVAAAGLGELPGWVLPFAALLGLAYVVHELR